MAAAWQLRDKDILLLEQNDVLGGRLKSLQRGDYWLNFGGHIFPAQGSHVRRLIEDLGGIETLPIPGSKTAMSFSGKVYDARWVESYPFRLPLSVRERVGLVKAGLIIRWKVMTWVRESRLRAGEPEADRRTRLSRFEADRTFRDLLGRLPEPVEAIFRTAGRRAPGEMEELSAGAGILLFAANWSGSSSGWVNLKGGSGQLGEAVRRRLAQRVVLGATVTKVEPDGDGALVHFDTADEPSSVWARRVIVATPAPVARAIVQSLPPEVDRALESVAYGPFVTMAILTTESGPMPWDDIYALLTPGLSFNMLFNHANPLRGKTTRQSGGSLMCYAGGQPGREMLELPEEEIARRFTRDLARVYPQLADLVAETVVQKWRHGNCFHTPDTDFEPMAQYSRDPANAIQFAGDYFAEVSGSIEDATRSGLETAQCVAGALG